jgi:hypothetical protein
MPSNVKLTSAINHYALGKLAGQSSVGSLVQLLHGEASGKVVSREIAMLATCWPGGEFNGDRIRW